jgi:hypothetical protein
MYQFNKDSDVKGVIYLLKTDDSTECFAFRMSEAWSKAAGNWGPVVCRATQYWHGLATAPYLFNIHKILRNSKGGSRGFGVRITLATMIEPLPLYYCLDPKL